MDIDATALLLARIQFAFTVSFHIIFPAISIGLASYLAVLEGLWYFTGRVVFLHLFDYWKKIFAVAFGMGVVSGIVMSYQFGTNWSVFSDRAGPVLGPLMGYEVLTAFFLEAGFLGVMLFGLKRVGPKLHFFATCMVALGTAISAFWILSVNSWMQTPQGYALNDQGQFVPTDWWAVVFNPSFPYRFAHMVIAAYLTTCFVVAGVGAGADAAVLNAAAADSENSGTGREAGPVGASAHERMPNARSANALRTTGSRIVVVWGGGRPGLRTGRDKCFKHQIYEHPLQRKEAARDCGRPLRIVCRRGAYCAAATGVAASSPTRTRASAAIPGTSLSTSDSHWLSPAAVSPATTSARARLPSCWARSPSKRAASAARLYSPAASLCWPSCIIPSPMRL